MLNPNVERTHSSDFYQSTDAKLKALIDTEFSKPVQQLLLVRVNLVNSSCVEQLKEINHEEIYNIR